MEYQFDVAISFASEQRDEASAIAECLKKSGIRVFYDKDNTADMWGKDGIEYFTDVFMNQAEYCMMLVSKAYLDKMWTTTERRSALARAAASKKEYILPVRFDSTSLPGLLPTLIYLPYGDYGIEGVCQLFLAKLHRNTVASAPQTLASNSCNKSPFAFIQASRDGKGSFVRVGSAQWATDKIQLTLEANNHDDSPFLDSLAQSTDVSIAFGNKAAYARVSQNTNVVAAGIAQWKIDLDIRRGDLSNPTEIGTSGISADEFAKIRARRILLNENPSPGEVRDLNKAAHEALIRGIGNDHLSVTGSPFPSLFKQYRTDPRRFLEFAWILAVHFLKFSATVTDVLHLQLTLNSESLAVDFLGRRKQQYVNAPPYEISVQGTCSL
jgi:hypothetical protein